MTLLSLAGVGCADKSVYTKAAQEAKPNLDMFKKKTWAESTNKVHFQSFETMYVMLC